MSLNISQEIPVNYHDYEETLTRFEHTPSRKDAKIEDLSVKECRICLERGSDLINSCSCKGSIGYLHR